MPRIVGLTLVTAAAVVAWSGYRYTRPEVVRAAILDAVARKLPGVRVELDAAHVRLLGGLEFEGLRVYSPDAPAGTPPALEVPRGALSHDKLAMSRYGRLEVSRVELDGATVRARRLADGRIDLADLAPPDAAPADPSRPLPTMVLRNAAVLLSCEHGGTLGLTDARGTVVNDPPGVLAFELTGTAKPFGPVSVSGTWARGPGGPAAATLDLPAIPVSRALAESLRPVLGDALPATLPAFEAAGRLTVRADYRPGSTVPLHYDVQAQLRRGSLDLPGCPLPIRDADLEVRCRDGVWEVERAQARLGDALATAHLELHPAPGPVPEPDLLPPGLARVPPALLGRLRKLEVGVRGLVLGEDLFARLGPAALKRFREFRPVGPVHLAYRLLRDEPRWKHRVVISPDGLGLCYDDFAYPLEGFAGRVEATVSGPAEWEAALRLTCRVGTRPGSVFGTVSRAGGPLVARVRASVDRIPLDETLLTALPGTSGAFVRSMRATGEGDLVADLFTAPGRPELHKVFRVAVRGERACYDLFPLPVEAIRGTLVIRPEPRDVLVSRPPGYVDNGDGDILELHDFSARHGAATVTFAGRKSPAPVGATVSLSFGVRSLPVGEPLRRALAPVKLENVWKKLAPSGAADGTVTLTLHDRPPPPGSPPPKPGALPFDPVHDVEADLRLAGFTIKPTFLPYEMAAVSGHAAYALGVVRLDNLAARHGDVSMSVASAELRERADEGVWANFKQVIVSPAPADAEMLAALPRGLRKSVSGLEPKGLVSVSLNEFTVDAPNDRGARPESGAAASPYDAAARARPGATLEPRVYWDGSIGLHGLDAAAGLDWKNIVGRVGSKGEWRGDRFGPVVGHLHAQQATLLGQRLDGTRVQFAIDPRQPDVVVASAVQGRLYGGTFAGQARLETHPTAGTLFDLSLTALNLSLAEVHAMNRLGDKVSMEGHATAGLNVTRFLDGRTGAPRMRGNGSLDIHSGRLLNLPRVVDLLKVLGLRSPDHTAFEEVHAKFTLEDKMMHVSQLDLLGNAISLGGEGHFDFAADRMHFEFYTVWSRMMKHWLSTPLGRVGTAVSRELFKMEMEGPIRGEIEFRKTAVPLVVDPLRRAMERMGQSRTGRAAASE